jgi:hypothetical protein
MRQSGIAENGRRDRTIRGEVTTEQQAAKCPNGEDLDSCTI